MRNAMRQWAVLVALGMTGIAPVPAADSQQSPQTELEAGHGREAITRGFSDWLNTYLEGSHKFAGRQVLSAGIRETRRFGLHDTEIYGSLSFPLSTTWTGVVDGNRSPTHEVLAKYAVGVQLLKHFSDQWSAGAGVRHNEFIFGGSNVATLLLEHRHQQFRGIYTLFQGKPEGAGWVPAHRFQLNYHYGRGSHAGIAFTVGPDNIGAPLGFNATAVRNWTVAGRHEVTRGWSITYEMLTHVQGPVFQKNGLRLGLRYQM